MIDTRNLKSCGVIKFQNEEYEVWRDPNTGKVVFTKPNDSNFGHASYIDYEAKTDQDALDIAPLILDRQMGKDGYKE